MQSIWRGPVRAADHFDEAVAAGHDQIGDVIVSPLVVADQVFTLRKEAALFKGHVEPIGAGFVEVIEFFSSRKAIPGRQ